MNFEKDVAGKRLAMLAEIVIEDAVLASDEQILTEAKEDGIAPTSIAAGMRLAALIKLRQVKRERLETAQASYRQATRRSATNTRPSLDEMRRRVKELVLGGAGGDLLIAFRNGRELSESDLEGLWDDLEELGLLHDDKPRV